MCAHVHASGRVRGGCTHAWAAARAHVRPAATPTPHTFSSGSDSLMTTPPPGRYSHVPAQLPGGGGGVGAASSKERGVTGVSGRAAVVRAVDGREPCNDPVPPRMPQHPCSRGAGRLGARRARLVPCARAGLTASSACWTTARWRRPAGRQSKGASSAAAQEEEEWATAVSARARAAEVVVAQGRRRGSSMRNMGRRCGHGEGRQRAAPHARAAAAAALKGHARACGGCTRAALGGHAAALP